MSHDGTPFWLLFNQAENLIQQGDQRGARALFRQAMTVASPDDSWTTALAYIRSGTTEVRLGEIERGLLYYGRGINALRGKGDVAPPPAEALPLLPRIQQELASPEMAALAGVRGISRLAVGMAARRAGNLSLAEAELRAALPLLAQDGDRAHQAVALLELAVVLDEGRRHAESEPLYRAAVDSAQAAGEARVLCDALHDLGVSLREQGRLAEAEPAFEQGAEAARAAGDKWSEARLRTMLGVTLLGRGQKEAAYGHLIEARSMANEVGPRHSLAICWRVEGQRWTEQGSYPEARQCLEYAANLLAWEMGLKAQRERAGCLRELGDVALASGGTAEARDFYNQSLDLYSRSGNTAGRAEAQLALGNVWREEGDSESAYASYTKAARQARALGASTLMGQCHVEAAQLYAMRGRIPEAQWNLACARALFAQGAPHLVADVDGALTNIRSYNPAAYDQLARAFDVHGLGDLWSLTPP